MPEAKAMPFMVARRSAGYHSAKAENEDIRQPETPSPMSARASVSSVAGPAGGKPKPPAPPPPNRGAEAARGQPEFARQVRPNDGVDRAIDVRDEIARQERQGDAPEQRDYFGASR